MQVQVNKMLQDNMLILETALSAVSSAEKLVFGIYEGKNIVVMTTMILLHGDPKKN